MSRPLSLMTQSDYEKTYKNRITKFKKIRNLRVGVVSDVGRRLNDEELSKS